MLSYIPAAHYFDIRVCGHVLSILRMVLDIHKHIITINISNLNCMQCFYFYLTDFDKKLSCGALYLIL